MFRCREPLRRYVGQRITHMECVSNDDGKVEFQKVDDCEKLPPVGDFDLEKNLRAGENVREVSSIMVGNKESWNFNSSEEPEKKQEVKNEN